MLAAVNSYRLMDREKLRVRYLGRAWQGQDPEWEHWDPVLLALGIGH